MLKKSTDARCVTILFLEKEMREIKILSTALILMLLGFNPLHASAPTASAPMQSIPNTDANIIGHVESAKTKEHLPYITVALRGTTIGVLTDATGHYFLKDLPIGEFVMEVSSVGYKTVTKRVTTERDKTVEINFLLEEDAIELDDVVVSASRNETNKRSAPIVVNVASGKLFESTASCNLTEALNFQPGLRVETDCSNCGSSQLRINGLGGQYSQILLDSRPIFSSLAGVYGLEQLPVGMVERVEVVRGGGSALFGASAIGGVVNIITKEPTRNAVALANTTNVLRGGKVDANTSLNASFVSDNQRAGVYIFGMLRDRDWYDRNKDGFTDVPKLESETIGFRARYRTSSYSNLTAEYHHIHEYRRGGDNIKLPPHETMITEELNHKIDGGGVRFNIYTPDNKHRVELYTSGQSIRRRAYFGVNKDPDAYGYTDDKSLISGAQYSLTMERFLFMPAELTTGVEYNFNNLGDHFLGLNRHTKQITRIYGGYLQNEWRTDKLSLLLGARLDKHNLVDNAVVSPRANVRYSPSEKIGLRASYSSGYRAPATYDEDLHVDAVGGALSIISKADNLKPEYSHSLSLSVDYYHSFGEVQTNFLAEGFHTLLNDVFKLERTGESEDGSEIYWERRNASGARIMGLNLEGRAALPGVFDIQLGYTQQSSRYRKAEEWTEQLAAQRRMFRAPESYGYLTALFNITPKFQTSIFGNYTGTMLVQHTIVDEGGNETHKEQKAPHFWDMGLKLSYNFKISTSIDMELSGGVKNIFDEYQKDLDVGYLKDANYIYGPSMPRMFFIGLKFSM